MRNIAKIFARVVCALNGHQPTYFDGSRSLLREFAWRNKICARCGWIPPKKIVLYSYQRTIYPDVARERLRRRAG